MPAQKAVSVAPFDDIVWTGSRFVAIAWDTFLDSADGITWHRQKHPARWRPSALAAGPGGVVAVGTVGADLAAWRSPDGLTWTIARDPFPGNANDVSDVIATPSGWLAVGGRLADICLGECEALQAFAWTSTDGQYWTRSPKQASLTKAAFSAVTMAGNGFVAGGRKGWRAAVWTSADGRTWKRTAIDTFGRPSANGLQPGIFGMATGPGAIVAVGADIAQDVGGHARAWWSTDGKTWTAAAVKRSRDGQMFGVVATADGFLAVGPSAAYGCRGGIWESTDGRAWACIATARAFDGFGPSAGAVSPVAEVVVGLRDRGEDAEPVGAVWWRPAP